MGERSDKSWDRWVAESPPLPQPRRCPVPAPVPLWEKRFCSEACGFPWDRLCSIQRWFFDDIAHEGIRQWDDSAGLEALRNAKARYFAAYHGRPCDIPLPDPDMYIEEVDHDAIIDPELVADLEKPPPDNIDPDGGCVVMDGTNWDAHLEQPIQPTGWGDVAEPKASHQVEQGEDRNGWNSNGWGWDEGTAQDRAWRSGVRDTYTGSDYRRSDQWRTWDNRDRNFSERGRRYVRKRDGGGRWGPRYTKPKYHSGAYQSDNYHWKNCRGRGSNWTANHAYTENYP